MQCNVLLRCSLPALLRCAGLRRARCQRLSVNREARSAPQQQQGAGLGSRGWVQPRSDCSAAWRHRQHQHSRRRMSRDHFATAEVSCLEIFIKMFTHKHSRHPALCKPSGSVLARIHWTRRKEEIKFAVFPHLTKCSKQNHTGSEHNRWDGSCGSAKFRLIFPNSANMTNNIALNWNHEHSALVTLTTVM